MVDCHTHCSHSVDSHTSLYEMINQAIAKGLEYIAITDHLDMDYKYCPLCCDVLQLDVAKHIEEVLQCKELYKDKIYVALGVECGFSKEAESDYEEVFKNNENWDIILNSIHTVGGIDCYFPEYFGELSQREAYNKYLLTVLDSVESKYSYDVISHIGYVTRKAPYSNTYLHFSEHCDIIDMILKSIINKGVSLELNSHAKGTGSEFLPSIEIVNRYIELGGSEFTFGSDAHSIDRIADKFGYVTDVVRSLGVKYYNIYKSRQKEKIVL